MKRLLAFLPIALAVSIWAAPPVYIILSLGFLSGLLARR